MSSRFCVPGGRLGIAGTPEPKDRMRAEAVCSVRFLDDSTQSFRISKQDPGQVLLDLVFSHLGLQDRDVFSLLHMEDAQGSPRWLEPNKPLKKQLKGIFPSCLSFRVRFFIADPNSLQQEQTRHLYFLQIKNDIQEGRLSCPLSSAVVLASYAVQAELGDYSPSEHTTGYLSGSHFLPQQDPDFLAKVESLHLQHRGLKQSEAELCFLNTARTLELYGVEMHRSRDPSHSDLLVGIASGGVAIFRNMICSNFFSWVNIIKISFKRKRFFIQLRQKHGESRDHTFTFIMPNYRACKNLWRSCVEHHTFFQVKRSLPHSKKPLPNHCTSSSTTARSPNSHRCRKVLGGMVWNPALRKSISAEHLETKSLPSRSPPITPNWRSPRLRHEVRKPRHSSVDNLASEMSYITESEDVFYTYRGGQTPSDLPHPHKRTPQDSELAPPSSTDRGSTPSPSPRPRRRHSYEPSPGEDVADGDSQSYGDQNEVMDSDLLLVRLTPDEEGKFGFNVKGGVDQKMPLVISHVSVDSPAGHSAPRLSEGDQIVLINGRDISEHTHEQVVMFIRASRESHSKELALLIRRKGVSVRTEPHLQYEPGFSLLGETILPLSQCGGTLEESMEQLKRGLQSGALLFQFEQLYRIKPGMSVCSATLAQNMEKNRYKDILPYDVSRVVLEEEEDDYINASHIKMEIGAGPGEIRAGPGEIGAGPVKRYVASQGPLPHTCSHFWQTVWETHAHAIVMLTTLTERGRPKCHQYWPDRPEVRSYGSLQVCCHSEECNLAYVFRELTLTNTEVGEERSVAHLQYVAWPDHGVPEDPSDFLDFVSFVRNKRSEAEPLVVHCSAGIGRTGVLITMETAMELIEKDQPVYPLAIIRRLRDQRAMMVQTASQCRFVCEAILRVYQEKQQRVPEAHS